MTHSPEAACCCGSAKSDATAEFSFTQAARCSNPDSGAPGDLARMSPHASPETPVPQAAPETGQAPDSIASPDSIHASPEDKVPIAR